MSFIIDRKDKQTKARAGKIETSHGLIETPICMPVGTQGTVKGIHQKELDEVIKSHVILGNTYHLYIRPGTEILEKAGGLHKFMNWEKPILTDSGGYQVYSLAGMRKIKEEGVKFKSHIDGRNLFFSPEYAIDVQRKIGADIIMAFDECTPYPCDYKYARRSMHMTHRWLKRCITQFDNGEGLYGYDQIFSPIVQGSTYKDLRQDSAKFIADQDQKINAIGGLSVGEPHNEMYEMTDIVTDVLPEEKPRYLMGVGLPENILECIALGIDMFDCVLPTRNARHGILYTSEGIINIKNEKWKDDFEPIDINSQSPTSQNHSKAYLRHLFKVGEALGPQIASIHNLTFYLWLVGEARKHIVEGDFATWKTEMVEKTKRRL